MKEDKQRRSNAQRTEETRGKLTAAARALFVEKGYAETGTPEIVRQAEVTRGALYHHFADKADLFRAVVLAEAQAVAAEINATAKEAPDSVEAILSGARAYFGAMARPGRAQLMLLDGPTILGPDEMMRIDAETGAASLRDGLAEMLPALEDPKLEALTDVMSAMFDRAALAIANGANADAYEAAMASVLRGLAD